MLLYISLLYDSPSIWELLGRAGLFHGDEGLQYCYYVEDFDWFISNSDAYTACRPKSRIIGLSIGVCGSPMSRVTVDLECTGPYFTVFDL